MSALKHTVIPVCICLLLYLSFCFATWQLNPGLWDALIRQAFAWLLFTILTGGTAMSYTINNNKA